MNFPERQAYIQQLFTEAMAVLEAKGKDYSDSEDALSNFKEDAKEMGISKYQSAAMHLNKQISAVKRSIRRRPEYPQTESEPFDQRLIDIINYAALLACIFREDRTTRAVEKIIPKYENNNEERFFRAASRKDLTAV